MSFIVRSVRDTGTITYHCSTPRFALEKLNDFRRADYWDIEVRTNENLEVPETDLLEMAGCDAVHWPLH